MLTIIEGCIAAFFLVFGCFSLFNAPRMQRMMAASFEKRHRGSLFYPMMLKIMNSRANTWNIRLSGVTLMLAALVFIYFRFYLRFR